MEYKFRDIEKKWQEWWKTNKVYKVSDASTKPKCYVLDMFPYPSGAGLHVGHPLGYIASDIYSRYKRLKGFNVLHPMGFDSFGLPAEQYALDTGQHPAVTTKKNIENFKAQLDNIGFCYDWEREVQTSDPGYYKWTQWIFLQLFNSFYNRKTNKAEPISDLIASFEKDGSSTQDSGLTTHDFSADEWKNYDEKKRQDILMQCRLAYCGYGEVNWCEALGTVLANDEVVNGVSERGGHPVLKKTLRQWYLRITEYADRLLEGLEKVDFSEAMKEMQTNWIGKSSGAEIDFEVRLTASPQPSPGGEGGEQDSAKQKFFKTADDRNWHILKEYGRTNRKNPTEAENILWQRLRNNQLGAKVRRQHTIQGYIVDFAFLEMKLVIEVDGEYHNEEEQKIYDNARTKFMNQFGLGLLRFTNERVIKDTETVIKEIKTAIEQQRQKLITTDADGDHSPSPTGEGWGEAKLRVYTTRPDTIFGVDFMVIAPEHELVEKIKSKEQRTAVDEYIAYVKSRSERERMAEKKITGVLTGAYALNPFDGREIPIWVSEYVLAGYGTGAIMAVPCGDQRDFLFAKYFNIPITNIIGSHFNGEEANPTKNAILENSDFINGMVMKDAIEVVTKKIEEMGIGVRKVNYKMRDAAFSRQRYWGEPFPIKWIDGIAYPLDESELPLKLPHVDSYKPGPEGEGPLANIKDWALIPSPPTPLHGVEKGASLIPNPSPQVEKGAALIPNPSPQVEKGAARVPKYSVYTPVQYELAKKMRKEYTEAEGMLWDLLRDNKLGVKFRRQHPIDKYIVDFICLQEKLIVEADGDYHTTDEQKFYDAERTRVLNDIGFEVIRFANEEITKHPYKVNGTIKARIEQKRAESSNNSPLHLWRGVGGEGQGVRETNTMPGYAGSSWYFLRYMDPHNDKTFCDRKISDYWNQVDIYIGGTEHAVGHLLYSRMWTKVLHDLDLIGFDEPYKRLVNQGMIVGSSRIINRIQLISNDEKVIATVFVSIGKHEHTEVEGLDGQGIAKKIVGLYFTHISPLNLNDIKQVSFSSTHVDVNLVDGNELNIEAYKEWRPEYSEAKFFSEEDGKFLCHERIEKMSKRYFNTVNPDDLCEKYGADTFRMYEMFLGPVEMSKPWDTKGIEGVHRFLKKFWRLFYDDVTPLSVRRGVGGEAQLWTDAEPTTEELKILHTAIKKIEGDTERFSFNTAVSAFMIATNELTDLKCHKRKILEPLVILLSPYAPHIAEELYRLLESSNDSPLHLWRGVGGEVSILDASFPKFEEKYIKETTKTYPVAINGKTRTELTLALDATQQQVEETVLQDSVVQRWLEGKQPKKIIYVKNKMINVVV